MTLEKPSNGNVTIKLTSRGLYTWVIDLPIADGDDGNQTISRIKKIDELLKDRFPNYVKTTTTRTQAYSPLDD